MSVLFISYLQIIVFLGVVFIHEVGIIYLQVPGVSIILDVTGLGGTTIYGELVRRGVVPSLTAKRNE